MKEKLSLFLFLILASYYVNAQQTYFPDRNTWEERTPESLGLLKDSIQKAIDFAIANEYSGSKDLRIAILEGFKKEPFHHIAGKTKKRGGPAGLIIKDGYIIAKWGDVERVDMTFSVTKSYLSTICGLAYDAGLIADLQEPVGKIVWDGTFAGAHNSQVNWEHLLTQSSDWSGTLFGMKDWADRPPKEGGLDDWKFRDLKTPGSTFEYNDVRVNVLSYALLQTWRKPLPMVLKEKIMDPIGASPSWRWYGYDNSFVNVDGVMMQSVSGGGHSGGGVFINTLDHARMGLLFLREGNWKGQQLISKDWIQKIQQPSKANESYGYMWWLNKGARKMEGLSEQIYYAAGFGGNYIVVDAPNNLVVVTRWLEPRKLGAMLRIISNSKL